MILQQVFKWFLLGFVIAILGLGSVETLAQSDFVDVDLTAESEPQLKIDSSNLEALLKLSEHHFNKKEYTVAIQLASKGLVLADKIENYTVMVLMRHRLALAKVKVGDDRAAIKYLKEGLELADRYQLESEAGILKSSLGYIYNRYEQYEEEYDIHYAAYIKDLKNHNDIKSVIFDLIKMGTTSFASGKYERGIQHFKENLTHLKDLDKDDPNYAYFLSFTDLNLARGYAALGQEELAKEYIATTKANLKKSPNANASAALGIIEGNFYEEKGDLVRALTTFKNVAKISASQILVQEDLIKAYVGQARIYVQQRKYQEAMHALRGASRYLKNTYNSNLVVEALSLKASVANELGLHQENYQTMQQLVGVKDSILLQRKQNKIKELSYQFDIQKKEKENQDLLELHKEREEALKKSNMLSYTFIGLFAIMFVLGILFFREHHAKLQLNKDLEGKVAYRTKQLRALNTELVEKNKELENFSYSTAHDLREPLRNISGFVTLLARRLGNKLDDSNAEFFNFIKDNVSRMRRTLDGVQSFSEISKTEVKIESVEVKELIEDLVYDLTPFIKDTKTEVFIEDLPAVQSDEHLLMIVLKSILENAITYNKSEYPKVWISYIDTPTAHHIEIKDNGMGIDASYHEQIFEMFNRLHHRGDAKGAGLGLAISKKIMGRLGGQILLDSKPEEGSTFTVALPKEA